MIPHGYNRVTEYQLGKYGNGRGGEADGQGPEGLNRDDFRLVPVIESVHASMHPDALTQRVLTLDEVRNSREIAPAVVAPQLSRSAESNRGTAEGTGESRHGTPCSCP